MSEVASETEHCAIDFARIASLLLLVCEHALVAHTKNEPARVYVEYLRFFCDAMIRQFPSAWHTSPLSMGVWNDVVTLGSNGIRRFDARNNFGRVLRIAEKLHVRIHNIMSGMHV